jgi:SAM-dependent methyltransferase
VLHLQCNTGIDTLSIASQLGAIVTGVDISDEAVTFAKRLSAESGIPGTFIRSDLFDWFAQNKTHYDSVFTSYGTVGWLSDIETWGAGIAAALRHGGRFAMIDFHPAGLMFNENWQLYYDYMGGHTFVNAAGVGDYVGAQGGSVTNTGTVVEAHEPFKNPKAAYEFAWGLGDILSALINAGLSIRTFKEYPYSNGWKPVPDMVELEGRRFTVPKGKPVVPFMFGIVAEKA